ncbi:MAG TPA: hypothetical protein VES67_11660 [Vicinamibacterales bacterium]|nr:hypothetical protein [Vicinamibacterales bacterium]
MATTYPKTPYARAKEKTHNQAADDLLGVAEGKRAVSRKGFDRDISAEVAEQAKREGWGKTPGPDHSGG